MYWGTSNLLFTIYYLLYRQIFCGQVVFKMNWDKMTAEPKSADGVAAANPIGLTNKYDSFMINMIINTT